MAMIKCLLFLSVALALHLVHADVGIATFYTPPYTPSACNGFVDEGVMIAAASDEIWDDKGACGRMYKLACLDGFFQNDIHPCNIGTSVIVKIVDRCPSPGCQGTIDLSQEAFALIANPDGQKIHITYELV